jgi:hypothetical protein
MAKETSGVRMVAKECCSIYSVFDARAMNLEDGFPHALADEFFHLTTYPAITTWRDAWSACSICSTGRHKGKGSANSVRQGGCRPGNDAPARGRVPAAMRPCSCRAEEAQTGAQTRTPHLLWLG